MSLAAPDRHPIRRGLLLAGIAATVLVAIVAVAGLAGALDELPPSQPPLVATDEVNQGQPWNVMVDGAALAARLEPAVLQQDGYWLAVVAEVEVTADESRQVRQDRQRRSARVGAGPAGVRPGRPPRTRQPPPRPPCAIEGQALPPRQPAVRRWACCPVWGGDASSVLIGVDDTGRVPAAALDRDRPHPVHEQVGLSGTAAGSRAARTATGPARTIRPDTGPRTRQ